MSDNDAVDIIIEAVEIFIQQILYVRDVYPAQIFKKQRFYNAPVFVSILPSLNNYLHQVLQSIRELHRKNQLFSIEIVIYRQEMQEILETYKFDMHLMKEKQHNVQKPDDEFLIEFEEQLRKALYGLAERLKVLKKLPNDAKFTVQMQTTESAFITLSQNANFQEFPWLNETTIAVEQIAKNTSFIPILNINAIGLNAQAIIA